MFQMVSDCFRQFSISVPFTQISVMSQWPLSNGYSLSMKTDGMRDCIYILISYCNVVNKCLKYFNLLGFKFFFFFFCISFIMSNKCSSPGNTVWIIFFFFNYYLMLPQDMVYESILKDLFFYIYIFNICFGVISLVHNQLMIGLKDQTRIWLFIIWNQFLLFL